MDPTDKAILVSLYISSLDPTQAPLERIRTRFPLPNDIYNNRIEDLVSKGLVEKNTDSLTFISRDAIKVVLVGGVFDLIHPGHIHTLKDAKAAGDMLVVIIARTATAQKIKKD